MSTLSNKSDSLTFLLELLKHIGIRWYKIPHLVYLVYQHALLHPHKVVYSIQYNSHILFMEVSPSTEKPQAVHLDSLCIVFNSYTTNQRFLPSFYTTSSTSYLSFIGHPTALFLPSPYSVAITSITLSVSLQFSMTTATITGYIAVKE